MRRAAFRGLLGVAALFLASSCSAGSNPAAVPSPSPSPALGPAPAGERVLFVGNSLTQGNDLPSWSKPSPPRAGGR